MFDAQLQAVSSFEAAARFFVDVVETIPATAWANGGLGEWDLRSLVGHTSRALSTVVTYLGKPAAVVEVASSADYFGWTGQQTGADPAAVAERGRQAGIALGADPAVAVRALLGEALAAVRNAAGDPIIWTIAGGMRLSDYLPTRTFELIVHTLDIGVALGRPVHPPAQVLTEVLLLATELAGRRGDGPEVLLALTGRQALPINYSVL